MLVMRQNFKFTLSDLQTMAAIPRNGALLINKTVTYTVLLLHCQWKCNTNNTQVIRFYFGFLPQSCC